MDYSVEYKEGWYRALKAVEKLLQDEPETKPPRLTRGQVENFEVQIRNNHRAYLREQIKELMK